MSETPTAMRAVTAATPERAAAIAWLDGLLHAERSELRLDTAAGRALHARSE